MFREVAKEEFKNIYFDLGGGRGGWTAEYWRKFFEEKVNPGWRFMVQEPEGPEYDSMFIVTDNQAGEYRLFFMTEESAERSFDHPGRE